MAKKPASPVVPTTTVEILATRFEGWTVRAQTDDILRLYTIPLGPDATEDDLKAAIVNAHAV